MYEPLEIDPSTKNKDLKEKADDEKKRERQKHQMNFADSSYNSFININMKIEAKRDLRVLVLINDYKQ